MMKLKRGDIVRWVDGYGETLEGEVLQVSESGAVITVDFCGNTLVFYRLLSGLAIDVDFCRAGAGLPEERGEGNIRVVAVFGKTWQEMVLIKQGAKIALTPQRGRW